MTPGTIPNEALFRGLAQKYFRDELSSDATKYMSSYWMEHTQHSAIEFDDEGNPTLIVGRHFGGCKWNGVRSRALDQLCVLTHLAMLPNKLKLTRLRNKAAVVTKSMGLDPTIDVFRQVCSLEVLMRSMPEEWQNKRLHVMIIGDGFGILGALFKAVIPNSSIIMVDIGRTLTFQSYHLQLGFPEGVHELADSDTDLDAVDFAYCAAENLEALDGKRFDIAANVTSMHEMAEPVVARYFDFLRGNFEAVTRFYCANRVHKVLPGGEVSAFYNYPWLAEDEHFLDGECPWSKFFFAKGAAETAPRLLGWRLPFIHLYDGRIAHRVTNLSVAEKPES